MNGSLDSIINLYEFTTGRAQFAMRGIRRLAEAEKNAELMAHADATIAQIEITRQLERRWSAEPHKSPAKPAAAALSPLLDAAVAAIRDAAVAQAKGADMDDPIHEQVSTFLKKVYPNGVSAVTGLPAIEKLAAVDDTVALLQGDQAPAVQELGLARVTKRLADRAEDYREALEAPPVSLVAWDRVRTARAESQGMLLETVCIIIGQHHQRTEEGTAARLARLAPILEQNDAIGRYLRARRAVDDVDPETGANEPSAPEAATNKDADKAEDKDKDKDKDAGKDNAPEKPDAVAAPVEKQSG